MLGDGDDLGAFAPEHGLVGHVVLPVAGEAGEFPDEYNLKGHILTSPFLAHPAEQGPVGDSPALGLVVVFAGDYVAVLLAYSRSVPICAATERSTSCRSLDTLA